MQLLIDHLTAFYLFYANDWINLGRALQAGPEATARYARDVNPARPGDSRFYEQALRGLAAQALVGAATMVLETGKHPGQLKDEVCSPGGSTIVGVEALERGGFRHAVAMAVYEAYQKTQQLGK